MRYLHLNPVRARMVKQPSAYAYSSHRAYLGDEALPWLTTDWVLGQFGSRINLARARYIRFINEGKADGHNETFYGGQADSRIVGEEDFVKTILKVKSTRHRAPRMTKIVAHVCRSYDLSEKQLLADGRMRLPAEARALTAWLALKTKAATLTILAQTFGRDLSTLSHALSRLEKRSRESAPFAKILNKHFYAISQA